MKSLWNWLFPKTKETANEQYDSIVDSMKLTSDIMKNQHQLKQIFEDCSDIVFRELREDHNVKWVVIYIESVVTVERIDDRVLRPILSHSVVHNDVDDLYIKQTKGMSSPEFSVTVSNFGDIVRHLLNGYVVILTAGKNIARTILLHKTIERAIEEPITEPVIRGPRAAFNENISTNLGILRERLKTPHLKMETFRIGTYSQTKVVISYLNGVATPSLLEEVRNRLSRIKIDGIIESGYIEEFLEDRSLSPFPQFLTTERPDVVVAGLLEGKVAIFVDGTPFVLNVPMTFWTGLKASEDYYIRASIATFIRWIRLIFLFIAIFAPSLYVAITTFHQEMLPTNLILSIAAAREPAPFPAMIEALIMEIVFEALREAGIRLPRAVGQAVSIVGALVIGQSAVQAGIISAPIVIVVSTTGIATFTIPRFNFSNGVRLIRFPMIFLAGTLGLYGIVLGFLGVIIHLTSLRSFGMPYFSPVAPLSVKGIKDIFLRLPVPERIKKN